MRQARARDLGVPFDGEPGTYNAITDVDGVEVGHSTIIQGEGKLVIGQGPVRTGVTAILPRGKQYSPVFAGWYSLNGNGEMTGTTWIEEAGFLEGPIAITNTHSVGVVRDAVIEWQRTYHVFDPHAPDSEMYWLLPVVAETFDGVLNDIHGQHVKPQHVFEALNGATGGAVTEGAVGGGTGMICHEFKGGIGTASRRVVVDGQPYMVGVLVQANYGARDLLTIAGVPVGREIADLMPEIRQTPPEDTGSIIVIVATDAPLLPHQLKRLARRVPMGMARVGSVGGHYSGDIFLAFSTANQGAAARAGVSTLHMLANDQITPFFRATIEATEEAIVNTLVAGQTMVGIDGNTVHGLPHDRLQMALRKYGRLVE